MLKVCEIIGMCKIELFNLCGNEKVKSKQNLDLSVSGSHFKPNKKPTWNYLHLDFRIYFQSTSFDFDLFIQDLAIQKQCHLAKIIHMQLEF